MSSLRKNIERIAAARGLSDSELGRRIGKSKTQLTAWLDDPPKRKEGVLKEIATALVVPDFFLLSDDLTPRKSIVDFRLSNPAPGGYERSTIRAIEFARQAQSDASIKKDFQANKSIFQFLKNCEKPSDAAKSLREIIKLDDRTQLEFAESRLLYAHVRRKIEECETFIFQFSFSKADGIGLALTSKNTFNSIVINTNAQIPARRLFTLAHEVYHCKLDQTGISDPDIIKNKIEKQCNEFAAEFLAPKSLVETVAERTISSQTLDINELRAFADSIKLSLAASLFRLVETGHYREAAVAQWFAFLKKNANPDFAQKRRGKRVEEWKYKLGKYGTRFAEVYGAALQRDEIDDYEFFRLSGIKPKYQTDYLTKAPKASIDDAEEDADG